MSGHFVYISGKNIGSAGAAEAYYNALEKELPKGK